MNKLQKGKFMKTIFLFLPILILSGCGMGMKEKKEEPVLITTTKPIEKRIQIEEKFNGIIESSKTIQIKNRTEGFLQKQYYKDGALVKKGDILYKIDDKPLKTDLNYAQAQLTNTIIDINNAKSIYEKTKNSYEIGGASQQDVENSKTNLEKLIASSEMIKANIQKIKLNISYTEIKAPDSGYLEKSQIQEGSFVNLSTPYLTNLYSNNSLYFTVNLPKESILKTGKISVYNKEYNSKLKFCEPKTNDSGLIKCSYEFSTKDKIELNSLGQISFQKEKNGLFIPQTALIQSSEGKSVYKIEKDTAYSTTIKTGVWYKEDIEIVSGLSKDDEIAINGISNLRNEAKITKGK